MTLSRRKLLTITTMTALAASIQPLRAAGSETPSMQSTATPLSWTFFQADQSGFRRTPVLLTGEEEAILIDGGFTLSDGKAVADAIRATSKKLTTIYVSCSDPDYYFSLRPITEAFPEAKVIARATTVEAIKGNVEEKLGVWGPQLKDNGPQVLGDVVIPTASDATTLSLEGETIDIVEFPDMFDRRYLWVPSLEAVFGGVLISSGVHIWMADTATPESRTAWIEALDTIISRTPKIVVPGHQTEGAPQGLASVQFTRDYLAAFEREAMKASNSADLTAAMIRLYPELGDKDALELGAKVVKGEMKWG